MSIAVVAATGAAAQNFPDRPIRVVVPFSAGSASDVVARLVLDKMSSALDQHRRESAWRGRQHRDSGDSSCGAQRLQLAN